jgi:hypothetical protein
VLLGRWIPRRGKAAKRAWAEAEATRIAAAAQPCVALLFATRLRTEVPALTQALRGREMRLELVRAATGAALYRACAARPSE